MLEKIEICFRDLFSAIQMARLYPRWHPEFKKNTDKAFDALQEALRERENLVVGIIGEELAFEKEIFFDLSKAVQQVVIYLKERGIERIEFGRNLSREEFEKFIFFLVGPKDQIKYSAQESLSLLGINNITAGKIKVSSETPEEKKFEKSIGYLADYENSVDKISSSFDRILNEDALDVLVFKSTVKNIMENLLGRYQDFLNLAVVKRFDLRTFFHIVNVSILSMYFSSKIGFSSEEVQEIGTAALFHDIGKLYISRKIIRKPEKLTEEEFTKVRNHVIIGTEILLKHVEALGILPVIVCFEHHLKYNLKGYPKVTFCQKPHIASSIVSICDVYDALSQRRNYKNDYPPKMIYELMLRERGESFEPRLLDKFFKITGVWPVGTIVVLSDGRVAVVREENEDDIFSPKVEVIWPREKRESIDLKLAKEKNKIEHSLNPLNEGKQYFSLIYSET